MKTRVTLKYFVNDCRCTANKVKQLILNIRNGAITQNCSMVLFVSKYFSASVLWENVIDIIIR